MPSKWLSNSFPNQLFTLCKVLEIKDIYEEIFGVNPYNPLNRLNEEGRERAGEYVDMLAANERFVKNNDNNIINIPVVREIRLYDLGSLPVPETFWITNHMK